MGGKLRALDDTGASIIARRGGGAEEGAGKREAVVSKEEGTEEDVGWGEERESEGEEDPSKRPIKSSLKGNRDNEITHTYMHTHTHTYLNVVVAVVTGFAPAVADDGTCKVSSTCTRCWSSRTFTSSNSEVLAPSGGGWGGRGEGEDTITVLEVVAPFEDTEKSIP